MNIVKKSILILMATLIAAFTSIQSNADVFGGTGQYVMMPAGPEDPYIWVMDTETGKVKICFIQRFPNPRCSGWDKKYE